MSNPDTIEAKVALFNERFDAWVKELRNPERKQGKGHLKNHRGEQCCLGVLCDVAGLATEQSRSDGIFAYVGPVTGHASFRTHPPKCVANSVGINEQGILRFSKNWKIPPHLRQVEERSLIDINDSVRFNFSQIADILELNKEEMLRGVIADADGDGQPG